MKNRRYLLPAFLIAACFITFLFVTSFISSKAQTEINKVVFVKLRYEENTVPLSFRIEKAVLSNGEAKVRPNLGSSDFRLELIDAKNNVLETHYFLPPAHVRIFSDGSMKEGPAVKDTTEVIPYLEGAKAVRLKNALGKIIATASLSQTAILLPKSGLNDPVQLRQLTGRDILSNHTFSETAVTNTQASQAVGNGKLNITVVSYKYTDMSLFHQDVTSFTQSFLRHEPYKSRASQIMFNTLDSNDEFNCTSGRSGTPDLGYTCNLEGIKSAVASAGIPTDFIVVLVNDTNGSGVSIGSIIVQSRGTTVGDIIFIHELGHSIGGLRDEYTYPGSYYDDQEGAIIGDYTAKNCFHGTPPSNEWETLLPGTKYYSGCGFVTSWYRSANHSVMSTASTDSPDYSPISIYWINQGIDAIAGPNPAGHITPPPPTPTWSARPAGTLGIRLKNSPSNLTLQTGQTMDLEAEITINGAPVSDQRGYIVYWIVNDTNALYLKRMNPENTKRKIFGLTQTQTTLTLQVDDITNFNSEQSAAIPLTVTQGSTADAPPVGQVTGPTRYVIGSETGLFSYGFDQNSDLSKVHTYTMRTDNADKNSPVPLGAVDAFSFTCSSSLGLLCRPSLGPTILTGLKTPGDYIMFVVVEDKAGHKCSGNPNMTQATGVYSLCDSKANQGAYVQITVTSENSVSPSPTLTPTLSPTPTPPNTISPTGGTGSCPKKSQGDADCSGAPSITDYAVWRVEYKGNCSSTNLTEAACGDDKDGNGSFLDADFNGDGRATLVDYQIWRNAFIAGG